MKKIEKLLMLLIALTTFSLAFNVKADMYSGFKIDNVTHNNIYTNKDEVYSMTLKPDDSFIGLISVTSKDALDIQVNGNTIKVTNHEIGQKELKIKWELETYFADPGSSEPIRHKETNETTIKVTTGFKFKGTNSDNIFAVSHDTKSITVEFENEIEGAKIVSCFYGEKTDNGWIIPTSEFRYQTTIIDMGVEYNNTYYNLPIEIDVGFSEKLDKFVNKTLKNYNLKPDEFFSLTNSWYSFPYDTFTILRKNNTECTINNDSTYSCPVTVTSWNTNINIDTIISGKIYGLVPKKQSALEWDYSYKFEDTLISFYGQKSDDIYCYSSDPSIISVEKCKMTAKKYGTATIYAFNINTLDSVKIKVNYTPSSGYDYVDFSETNINEYLNSLPDELEIDYKKEYASYDAAYAYLYKFREIFNEYFNTDSYIEMNSNLMSDNSAKFTFNVWDSLKQEYKEYETKEITFKFTGLKLITPCTYVDVLSEDNLTYVDALEGTEDVEVLYDPNFVELTGEGNERKIKFIKSGHTTLSLKKGDYINTYNITVNTSMELISRLEFYIKDLDSIELPFSREAYKNNLNSLQNTITKYLFDHLPEELQTYSEDLGTRIICYDETLCSVSLGIKELDYSYPALLDIKYDETNTDLINFNLNPIKLTFNEYIQAIYEAGGDKDTYDSNLMLMYQNKLNEMTLNVSPKFNVNMGCDEENPVIHNELFGLYGDYLISTNVEYDGYAIFNGYSGVIANKVLTIPMDNKLGYAEYVKNYMDNLFDKDTTVTSITKSVYRVNFGAFNIDVVVNPIDAVPVTYISGVSKKLITLDKNGTYQINLNFGPENYNIDPAVIYEVEDESIASIDATGKVTGLKEGITLAKCSLAKSNWPEYVYIFIGVGKTKEDILNYYFDKYVPSDLTINYGWYNDLDQEVNSALYSNVPDYRLSSGFSYEVELRDNKYYAGVVYYDNGTRLVTEYKPLNITFKGIYTKERDYFLSPGDVVDTEYYFTEGSKKNVTYRIDNEEVATFDLKTGEIKALKKGATQIYLMDSKGVYNTTLNVHIDYDAYIEELLNSVDVIEIDANEAKRNGNHNAFYSAIQNELNLYLNGLDNLQVNCNDSTCTMLALDKQDKEYRKTYKYVKTGFVFEEEEIEMNAGDSKLLEYTRYPSTSDKKIDYKIYTLGDYGNDVCELDSNDIIKTHVPGGCIIVAKNPDSKYRSILTITVGKDIIINDLNTLVNKLPDELDINSTVDPLINDYGEETDAYMMFVQKAIREKLGVDDTYWFNLDYTNFVSDREVEVKITRNFIVDRPEEMLYASVSVSSEDSKTVKLKFKDSVDEGDHLEAILESLQAKYELSLLDYLKYRLDENRNMAEHSDFGRTIESYPGYTFLYEAHGGYAGDSGEGQMGVYALIYNGGLIKTGTVEFNVDYTANNISNLSQEEFIGELKKIVGNAYNEASSSVIKTSSVKNAYTINFMESHLLGSVDASDVNIAFAGVTQEGKELYDVDVENIAFVLGVTRASSKDYIIDVKDIKLSKTNLTLNIGSTGIITATISPSDATNKNITWTSSNKDVATVENGRITAKGAGTATITVKSNDGMVTKQITVTVQSDVVKDDVVKGDANGDGKVNINDVIILRKYLAGLGDIDSKYRNNADATGDGKININDVIKIRKYLAGIERL